MPQTNLNFGNKSCLGSCWGINKHCK